MSKYSRGTSERGRVKLRIVDLEIDGGDDTIADSVKNAVTAALSRNGGREPLKIVRPNSNGAAALNAADDDVDVEIEHEEEESVIAAPRRSSALRKRRTMNVLDGIDFDSAGVPITEYMDGLNLDSGMKKFTAVAGWFKEQLGIASVTADHVFSAYKRLGWNDFPKHPMTTFKDLATKREYQWFNKAAERGQYAINYIGEQKITEWRKA